MNAWAASGDGYHVSGCLLLDERFELFTSSWHCLKQLDLTALPRPQGHVFGLFEATTSPSLPPKPTSPVYEHFDDEDRRCFLDDDAYDDYSD